MQAQSIIEIKNNNWSDKRKAAWVKYCSHQASQESLPSLGILRILFTLILILLFLLPHV